MIKTRTISKTDEEILAEYRRKGDPELIGRLFNEYIHLVYGLCLNYLKSREESQDAVMNVYEKVSETLKTTEVRHFKSWLYMVSKNYCLMELRKANPEKTASVYMENAEDVHLTIEEDVMDAKLDALDESINQKEKELQDQLAVKRDEAIRLIDEKIKELK